MTCFKALKLRIYQESACYKKPFAFKVAETYPLPPYSTIKGFIHYLLKAQEFIPMSIAVQGTYQSLFNNYQTMRFYKNKEITKMPLNIHLLYDINLIVHIKAENHILEEIYHAIINSNEFYSIGRREDLARIDEIKYADIKFINIDDEENDSINLKNNVYIPYGYIDFEYENINGINYRLNYKYETKDNVLIWEKADIKYVEKGNFIESGIIPVDDEYDVAFFYPLVGVENNDFCKIKSS